MFQHPLFLITMYLLVAVLLRCLKPNVLTALFLLAVMVPATIYLTARHGDELLVSLYKAEDSLRTIAGDPPSWPPEVRRTYPDLQLVDQDGNFVRLSDFKGRVILLQPIAARCSASVAFSGGNAWGPYHETVPQKDLDGIDTYAQRYARVQLDDPRLVFVQLLLFNEQMQAPEVEEIIDWAQHFGLDASSNQFVLGGTPELATAASRELIPGFQLIDQHFVLRMDSTGYQPKDDLYRDLLPLLSRLLNQSSP